MAGLFARIRTQLTYANAMATIAVFIALGGSAYAALNLTGGDVVNGSLTGKDVKDYSIKSRDVDKRFVASLKGAKGAPGESAVKLWAAVHSTGLLARGSGATGVRTLSGGSYEVAFDRDVTSCGYIATVGNVDPLNPTAGYAVVSRAVSNPNAVHVQTKHGDGGENGDRDFYVAALC